MSLHSKKKKKADCNIINISEQNMLTLHELLAVLCPILSHISASAAHRRHEYRMIIYDVLRLLLLLKIP